ncbi:MAG: GtrA family protein [Propionibacteriaceae bacterium]|jgi:putative flippase GtrA|nr:GtrA family protein [Propionibacteriaceae bacterium]
MQIGAYESAFTTRHLTRSQELAKFLRFVAFSLSAGLIQVAVFTALAEGLRLAYWVSYLPALVASVLWSFTANRRYTFKSVSNIPVAMAKVGAYYLVFTPLSTWWGRLLGDQVWGVGRDAQYYIVLIGTMLVNFGTEFLVYRFWVYRRSINSSATGRREQNRYELRYDG